MDPGQKRGFDALTKRPCVSCFTTRATARIWFRQSHWTAVCCVQTLHRQIGLTPWIPIQFSPVEGERSAFRHNQVAGWRDELWLQTRWTADMKTHRAARLQDYLYVTERFHSDQIQSTRNLIKWRCVNSLTMWKVSLVMKLQRTERWHIPSWLLIWFITLF